MIFLFYFKSVKNELVYELVSIKISLDDDEERTRFKNINFPFQIGLLKFEFYWI